MFLQKLFAGDTKASDESDERDGCEEDPHSV